MVGHHRQPVFPAQLAEALDPFSFGAQVDLPVGHAAAIEIGAQRFAVGTPVGGEDQNRIERHLATQTSQILNSEFGIRNAARLSTNSTETGSKIPNSEFRIPNSHVVSSVSSRPYSLRSAIPGSISNSTLGSSRHRAWTLTLRPR